MDFSKVKWTNVKLQYNRQKNQWQMVYSAKAIPLGKDDNGILRYKPVRKPVSIPAIREEDSFTFQEAFNGFGAPSKCGWLLQKNLCVYLIDVLTKKQIISIKTYIVRTQYFWNKNPSKVEVTIRITDKEKPRELQAID